MTTQDDREHTHTLNSPSQNLPRPHLVEPADAWYHVYHWLKIATKVPGDLAECGAGEGHTSASILTALNEFGESRKQLHLFDRFDGVLNEVKERLAPFQNYEIHAGEFAETFHDFRKPLCFIFADGTFYKSIAETIRLADKTLVTGGIIMFHDVGNRFCLGVDAAIQECLREDMYYYFRIQKAPPDVDAGFGVGIKMR